MLGVGISGSFAADQAPIFVLGGAAVLAVVVFHELVTGPRGRVGRLAELLAAIALIAGLLALTGYASSPFAMLFALVASRPRWPTDRAPASPPPPSRRSPSAGS